MKKLILLTSLILTIAGCTKNSESNLKSAEIYAGQIKTFTCNSRTLGFDKFTITTTNGYTINSELIYCPSIRDGSDIWISRYQNGACWAFTDGLSFECR